jgi:hypothetical protein
MAARPLLHVQNLVRDDAADQSPRDVHYRSVVGPGQTDDVALFPFPEQLDGRRERGILGDVQTEFAYRRYSILSGHDLGHAASPPPSCSGSAA